MYDVWDLPRRNLAGLLISMGGYLAFKPGTAMDTAVINQKVVHCMLDGFQGWRGSGVIQIGITATGAIHEWNKGIQADKKGAIVFERRVGHMDFLFLRIDY
jgi:hypothetical protein